MLNAKNKVLIGKEIIILRMKNVFVKKFKNYFWVKAEVFFSFCR